MAELLTKKTQTANPILRLHQRPCTKNKKSKKNNEETQASYDALSSGYSPHTAL